MVNGGILLPSENEMKTFELKKKENVGTGFERMTITAIVSDLIRYTTINMNAWSYSNFIIKK